jgi:galactokinase
MGGLSVLAAVGLYVDVVAEWIPSRQILLGSADPPSARTVSLTRPAVYDGGFLDIVEACCRVAARRWDMGLAGLAVHTGGSLPSGAGLSSSAAAAMAVLAAIDDLAGSGAATTGELCDLAFEVEAFELRTGAGQMDFYSVAQGGVLALRCETRPPSLEPLPFIADVGFVIGDSRVRHATGIQIADKRVRAAAGEPAILRYKNYTNRAVHELASVLRSGSGDDHRLGELMTRCHESMRDDMSVSTPLLDKAVEVSVAAGALGCKLTGSGGGGCVAALVRKGDAPAVAKALRMLGFAATFVDLDDEGVVRGRELP